MKQKLRLNLKNATFAVFAAVAILFATFAVYMIAFKDNNVYSARDIASYNTVKAYSEKTIEDASAPAGIRREYSWQIEDMNNNESCLIFYVVHSYAEVRIDGELVYSLTEGGKTHIGSSPSSNWVVVPLYQSDVGRTVTVTVTPVYKSVMNRSVTFQIGSRYAVFMHRLKIDLPQICLSALCIVMGVLLIIVQLCFIVRKRPSSFDMLYMGIFSLLVGIWRITDTRYSAMIFAGHTAALGYVTLSALFILAPPALLFAETRHRGKFRPLLQLSTLATGIVAFVCLVCQVTGIADLRETLTVCHITIIVDIAVLFFVSFFNTGRKTKDRFQLTFMLLLSVGSVADFIIFYLNGSSSQLIFTTVAFLIYTVYLFAENIMDINKKAYIEVKTGLFNKAGFEMYLKENIPDGEPIGMMMFDLNRLKYTNDTLGHKEGDRMIIKFAEILRNSFSSGEFICRWGGDEFVAVVRNADRKKLEHYNLAVHTAVDEYNSSGGVPEIHFAVGYALSAEFPGISKSELLAKADRRMYLDKQEWYANHADL